VDAKVIQGVDVESADKCREACEGVVECGCYAFHPDTDPWNRCQLKKGPCDDFSDVDESKGTVSGSCQICDWCTPEKTVAPALVIPFYERDICKMRMTAASITVHDSRQHIGDVHLLWLSKHPPSEYAEDIDHIMSAVNVSHKAEFHDMSFMFGQSDMAGWFVQQVMKLKAASLVKSPYYVVLDAKNTFIKDVEANTFISTCNTGMVYADSSFEDMGQEKMDWYHKSADALGVSVPHDEGRKWSASVTPVVMHTKTVKDMLGHLSEDPTPWKLCKGPLCDYIHNGATEFALYYTYVAALSDERCIHYTVPASPAVALWRGVSGDSNEGSCNAVAGHQRGVVMFGAQAGSANEMAEDQKQRLAECLSKVYTEAALHDPAHNSDSSLMDCVIGG
jgi:hypothetical protein